MDFGESESVLLYQETNADYLLIDDKKARLIAENFGINCIGTIGLLSIAKDKGVVNELKPIFEAFLRNKRYYSLNLMNKVLVDKAEEEINYWGQPKLISPELFTNILKVLFSFVLLYDALCVPSW